jgi:tRNA(Ile2) C34 agmatinyltransferase TiaS
MDIDSKKKQDKPRKSYDKRPREKKEKERKMNPNSKRCPHCGNEMRCRGASDSMGGISWKCRNKKCGRTIWERKQAVAPEPVAPQSYMDKVN